MEVFTAEPPCAGCTKLLHMAEEIAQKFKGKVKVLKYIGPSEKFEAYKLTIVPAIVFNQGKIKIAGVCPSKETLCDAFREAGLMKL